jgi:hypothetical protein
MMFIKYVQGCVFVREPSKVDEIEKTLQTMIPSNRILQHQYHAKNYQNYSDLIRDLLQAEKHDELTLRNHHQRFVGSAPLPEVHYNGKGNKKVMDPTTIKRSLVNSRRANAMAKTRRTEPKDKGKAKLLHAINVVVQTTLLRNAEPRNTWLNCTKDP